MSASTHVTSLSSCSCDWNYMKRQAVFLSVRFPPLRPRSLPLGKGQHLRNRNFKGLRCWKLVSPSWPRFGEQHRGMGACGPADISCMLLPHRSSCLKAAVIPRLPPRYVHDEQISGFVGSRKGTHARDEVMTGYHNLVKMSRLQCLVRIPLLVVLSRTPVITVHLRRTPGPGCS